MRSILWPPSLVSRQLTSALYFSYLVKWNHFPQWFFTHGFGSLPVSAGSIGMGCIGFPNHPAWEVTSACNLRCIHCHATSSEPHKDELTTSQAKKFIEDLARVRGFRMLVYTGGEPLVRPDIFELLHHSKRYGFTNVLATNGTLIDEKMAFKLRDAGVVGAAVSLDSSCSQTHNYIRRNDNAFDLAMRGIRSLKRAGILVQVNSTAMDYNFDTLDELIDLADKEGAGIMLMYQLVPVGRGAGIEEATLDITQNEKLLKSLARKQRHVSTIIEPVAGPQYWPYLMQRQGKTNGIHLKFAERVFHGCSAGRGFVYIKANGDVWPCPFVGISAGNVKETPFASIWRQSEVFTALRNREHTLKGACGKCQYRKICGGCRGRAMAYHGDYLAEDPSCFLHRDEIEEPVMKS
ncbi:MAG: radical SAM protein [Dehalococcoidia bacterium]|nr:radical SAM protein [Dehalococcoidia bacterium]